MRTRSVPSLERVGELLVQDRLNFHRASEADESSAWTWLRRHDEHVYSFVDATSFETMRTRRIREALAFDPLST